MNANAILGWVKSHLVIVVCSVLILVLLPVGWIFSNGWTRTILEDRKKEVEEERRRLTQAESVTYVVPPLLPGEQAIEHRAAPNPVLTTFFQRVRSERASQADAVLDDAIRFNRGGDDPFEPLVDGLFPTPSSADPAQERRLTIQMARALAGDFRGQEPAYRALFEEAGAGSPPDPADVQATMARVQELAVAQQSAEAGQGGAENPVDDAVRAARIAAYAQRARQISFYADPQESLGQGIRYPRSSVGAVFTLDQAFEWQLDYWLVEMILDAVSLANTPGSGLPGGVPDNPIKRVLLIDAQPPVVADPGGDDFGYGRTQPQTPTQNASHTGRSSSSAEDPYIVRDVDLSLVVASDDLVRVIEAFGRSNFITVTGVRISDRDEWQDLSAGYFYGDEHVVRLDLDLETIWLKSWLAEFAPPQTRERLGLPEPETDPEAAQSSAAAF